MRKSSLFVLFGGLVIVAFAPRCGGGGSDCTQTSTCPSDASDGPPPLSCDMTKDPKDQTGCLDNRVGVFVDAANGKDSNAGTKEAPFQTIGKALTSTGSLTRVYVCEGIYPEDVSITPPVDGISVYGGFKCIAWTYTGNQPQIGKSQMALKVAATTKAFTLQDLLFHSADGAGASPSSMGGLVANATGAVTINRCNFVSGVGLVGADAAVGANYSGAIVQSDPKIQGHDASGNAGGQLQTCANLCTDTIASTGGQGGAGGGAPSGGSGGAPSLGGGAGGIAGQPCAGTGTGGDGTNQPTVGIDAVSPTVVGTLSDTGWATGSAAGGKNGAPGQGGGGGAGASSGGGGGGGCGGCGGGGGNGGSGGGASIAFASLSSTVAITNSQFHASDAGNGGKGGAGQVGQMGGFAGNKAGNGCLGGNGGNGSAGGTGAGGIGGLSVAILYKGTQPTTDGATNGNMAVGKAGTKGVGGKAGTNDGLDGTAQPFMAAP
jgi:hypothetical protein